GGGFLRRRRGHGPALVGAPSSSRSGRPSFFWADLTSANRLRSPSVMPSSVATCSRRASTSHCFRIAAFSVLSRSLHATTSAGFLKMLLGLVSAFFLSSLASMSVSVWWRHDNGRPRTGVPLTEITWCYAFLPPGVLPPASPLPPSAFAASW